MSIKDIETILDTLRFDGKLEMTEVNDTSAGSSRLGEKKLYRAVKPILTSTGLVRVPCGICPVGCRLYRATGLMQAYHQIASSLFVSSSFIKSVKTQLVETICIDLVDKKS